ncbi:hypothetical protein GJ672_09035 [Spiribacter sp. 2438]|nr:hypothetical protein GJ672_09035 [Spiribacter sp. 2438]
MSVFPEVSSESEIMIYIPSKYSVSHYTPVGPWLRQRAVSIWNSVPDPFIKPYISDLRFGFVLGCGHSGTTLIAAKLGGHSDVFLIGRETNAFGPGFGAHCSRRIVKEWSYFAELEGKGLVLEKTPKHVHAVRKIKRVLPDAMFIAIVRNPLDNVASLYTRFGNLEGAIARWKVDNKRILSLRGESSVKVVNYENLTREPKVGFRELCDFLNLPWQAGLIAKGDTAYDSVKQKGNMAVRAEQVSKEIKPKINTWPGVLTEKQAKKVLDRTKRLAAEMGYEYSKDLVLGI